MYCELNFPKGVTESKSTEMKTYTDNYECGHCDKDTKQEVEEDSTERECRDRFTCLECGWTKVGMSGEWQEP